LDLRLGWVIWLGEPVCMTSLHMEWGLFSFKKKCYLLHTEN
jgi:hypothetical protein